LGTTRTDLLTQLGTTEANLKADFTTRIGDVQTELKSDIGGVKTDVANLSQDVQTKYDALTEGQKDLATQLAQQGLRLSDAIELVRTQTAEAFTNVFDTMATNQATTQKSIEETAAATQAAAAAEAERTRQANARNAANQAKLGNVNTLMQMLGQAKDTGGQQVTVKAADPAKIGYIYDFNSIFANPQQAQMFASPYGAYAQGGTVEDVNDELLKLLRG
jgi:antitoxin component of RelBE/YafQ-DinJ toxin-antitoxin module